MAITKDTVPNNFIGAFNQVVYTISSNNTAQPNFNFIVDIKETISGTLLARLKYPKQPGATSITFDIGDVLRNSVSYDFLNAQSAYIAANTNSRVKYYVEFRELFDNGSGVPTLSGVLASDPATPSASSFKLATNAIFDFEDFTPTAYLNCNVSGFGFLNAATTTIENIEISQNKILTFFDPNRLAAKVVLLSGSTFTQSFSLTARENLFNINAGKWILDTSGLTLANGTYVIQIKDSSDVILASKTFTYTPQCSYYPTVRLHWLNKLGAFESFNFIRNSTKSEEIERKQFKAPLRIGYLKSDKLKTNFNTTINDTISINSDWINEEQSVLLEQLATSPVIYLERSATDFIAVNITNTNYETKKYLDNRSLFNLSFDIEYTYSRYRQSL
jgi:hypothetical protein